MMITFHTFHMGDVEDVEIYVAQPIHEWQQTKHGQWVIENAHDLTWYQSPDPYSWGIQISVRGELHDPRKVTEYFLKWPKQQDES